jgi:Arc/MetJ-type ribon-helix-helix transcriptional regulator
MRTTRVALRLDTQLVQALDELVAGGRFPNRSQAIATAIAEAIERARRARLGREAAKLDPNEEKRLAEECWGGDPTAWPQY